MKHARTTAAVVVAGAVALAGCIRFAPATSITTSDTQATHATNLVTGDFTGDGSDDVLVFGDSAGPVRMDSCGPGCLERHERLDATVTGGFAADVDGDGIDDLVSGTRAFLGASTGLSSTRTITFTMPPGNVLKYAADFTGDHRVDLIGTSYIQGGFYLQYSIARGNGAGGFGAWEPLAVNVGELNDAGSAVGDIDGDGAAELLVTFSGHVTISDPGNNRYFDVPGVPANFTMTTGDIDGDGRDDLGLVSSSRLVFYRSTGTGFTAFTKSSPLPVNSLSNLEIRLEDFEGDGAADLYLRDGTGAETWRNGTADGAFPFNPDGTVPALTGTDGHRFADLDGDGRPEIVRPNGGDFGSIEVVPNTSYPS